jgi:TRAP-type mannitol/chloroaromatic compound transport system permease small subunit
MLFSFISISFFVDFPRSRIFLFCLQFLPFREVLVFYLTNKIFNKYNIKTPSLRLYPLSFYSFISQMLLILKIFLSISWLSSVPRTVLVRSIARECHPSILPDGLSHG